MIIPNERGETPCCAKRAPSLRVARQMPKRQQTLGSTYKAINLAISDRPYHSIIGNNDNYFDLLTSFLLPLEHDKVRSIQNGLLESPHSPLGPGWPATQEWLSFHWTWPLWLAAP
ncbi:hypothetical protein [Azotobacter chroococcum]|uniref:Uncharacterized protein n=1 Tax=Azotobacter chroococcum TaxID=353 RepID=A0AAP9YGQ7_9GAMM|nr:hypothetical protein [Azotobacter chroococcum]QQE91022.1 hypothetical protein GKQ51_06970 [Azotobacter chroococcum]